MARGLREHGMVLEDAFECYRIRLAPPPLPAAQDFLSRHGELAPVVCLEPGVLQAKAIYHLWMHLWTESEAASCEAISARHSGREFWEAEFPRRRCFKDSRFTLEAAKVEL